MNRNRLVVAIGLVAAAAILFGGFLSGRSQALTPAGEASKSTGIPDYFTTPNWANSPKLRKFVDTLPGVDSASANNLGQYIPLAIPDKLTYPGSDYYEIELGEYSEQMHSDLPVTKLRGYRQTNMGGSPFHYLGPLIIAQKETPVRIKFTNSLPTGTPGKLFIPVDTTVMGAGPFEIDYLHRPFTTVGYVPDPVQTGMFAQNRATLHLHGGRSPWISDGTPHQWIAPAGETAIYPKGVSVAYVPDMWFDGTTGATIGSCAGQTTCGVLGATNDPGDGSQTFFWTNDQSARMMFFHDHAWGITRLGVYVGGAAGYLLQDATETDLKTAGLIPPDTDQIPLVIQDKTYVDGNATSPTYVLNTDPTWNWGSSPGTLSPWVQGTPVHGDLWWPHVYMPAQDPFNPDLSGINPFGRWHYGPWFWPPTTNIAYGPINNPYRLAPYNQPEPYMPAAPNPSWVAEAFMDTPVINGTAYPTLTLQPKAYRFRILNAAHDRFFNLQMYIAADKGTTNPADPTQSSARTSLFWRNTATGENVVWTMDGPVLASVASLPPTPDLNWEIVGTADFDLDGKHDILWRNAATGQNLVWYMDGASRIGYAYLNTVPNLAWKIVGIADFNGDSKPDILWRNSVNGDNLVWYMNGVTMTGSASLNSTPNLQWKIVGTGDFDGDGKPDILWRNSVTGDNLVWYMNGVAATGSASLNSTPNLQWDIVGTGDLNNDGKPDILWRNSATGEDLVWYMDGVLRTGSAYLSSVADLNWKTKAGGSSGVILCNGTERVPQTSCTEVKMVPAVATTGFPPGWPTDGRVGGVPDPATAGPSFIQIGTEGGFLPAPVELPMQPVVWNTDPTTFTAGNVLQQNQGGGTLFLGPAERADIIVDLSQYAGKTLILYNDAPAPFPALDPHYDYYTGAPDNTGMGGSAGTLPGYGPNTRTLMQIKVAATGAAAPFDVTALQAAFLPSGMGVFENGQSPIIVGQSAYDGVYTTPTSFPSTWPYWGLSRITDNYLQYQMQNSTFVGDGVDPTTGHYMEPKAIQDEMGEVYDEYGRGSAKLGLESPFTTAGIQTFVLQNYVDPSSELVTNNEVQIWKITHNGVDTHPIHFHLFEVQVLNRVGWDGFIYLIDPNELGWKDTVRISPLEDTIVALRAVAPTLDPAFRAAIPHSVRPLNPAFPLHVTNADRPPVGGYPGVGFATLDKNGNPVTTYNDMTDFGWEYVWHCHILSHEENDMMRSVIFTPGP